MLVIIIMVINIGVRIIVSDAQSLEILHVCKVTRTDV